MDDLARHVDYSPAGVDDAANRDPNRHAFRSRLRPGRTGHARASAGAHRDAGGGARPRPASDPRSRGTRPRGPRLRPFSRLRRGIGRRARPLPRLRPLVDPLRGGRREEAIIMKTRILAALLALGVAAGPARAQEPLRLSLSDAIRRALDEGTAVRIATSRVTEAEAHAQ